MKRHLIPTLVRLIAAVEGGVDRARYAAKARRGWQGPIRVVPYRGFGTAQRLRVTARVLSDPPLPPSVSGASGWENLRAMLDRFETDEVPGARVLARLGDLEVEATADEEGYLEWWLEPRQPLPRDRSWHDVELELIAPKPGGGRVTASAPVLVPPLGASFGVISDIDDTVVRTNATALLRMARELAFGNAHTRVPFEGVSAFYAALQRGALGTAANPIFYVSSSPWNLYDLLVEYFELQRIPLGPILLRDWGITPEELLPRGHAAHKLRAIRQILELYPELPFVLVGDSGQEDPEIYATVMRELPGRVHAAYIRNVSTAEQRVAAIRALAEELAATGGTLLLADDTVGAAQHAAEQGWIDPAALPGIGAAAAVDGTPE